MPPNLLHHDMLINKTQTLWYHKPIFTYKKCSLSCINKEGSFYLNNDTELCRLVTLYQIHKDSCCIFVHFSLHLHSGHILNISIVQALREILLSMLSTSQYYCILNLTNFSCNVYIGCFWVVTWFSMSSWKKKKFRTTWALAWMVIVLWTFFNLVNAAQWTTCSTFGSDLYRCTMHFAESFDQHTNQCTYIKLFILKHLKLLQHVSILRSSSGSCAVPC